MLRCVCAGAAEGGVESAEQRDEKVFLHYFLLLLKRRCQALLFFTMAVALESATLPLSGYSPYALQSQSGVYYYFFILPCGVE